MNCPYCGTSNFDNASICANCGRALAAAPAPPHTDSYTPPPPPRPGYGPAVPPPGTPIPNYLIQSILTLCCCFPLGIVAIIFAAQVNSKLAAGDVAGAEEASRKARMFCWLAFGIGLVLWILILLTNGALLYTAIQEGRFSQ